MKLTRYLIAQIALAIVMALAALTLLFSFFDLLAELGNVSAGTYSIAQATLFIAFQIPTRIHEVLPIATLLGALFAFARLAQNHEYTIMRTSAWSPQHAIRALALIGLALAIITIALSEFVLPASERLANQVKTQNADRTQTQNFRSGLWARDNNTFLNVRQVLPDTTLIGIRIYTLDNDTHLLSLTEADRGQWDPQGAWKMQHGKTTQFTPQGPQIAPFNHDIWQSKINPDLLSVLMVKPERMEIGALYHYIQHLKTNKQKTTRYEIALWKKLIYPLSPLVMLLLSLPFAYFQTRGSKIGGKLMLGLGIGLGFHLLSKISSDLTLLQSGSPFIAAALPIFLFAIAASIAILRVERV